MKPNYYIIYLTEYQIRFTAKKYMIKEIILSYVLRRNV